MLVWLSIGVLDTHGLLGRQTEQDDAEGVTVRGQIQVDAAWADDIEMDSFNGSIIEQVKFLQPEFPNGWSNMTQAERAKWLADFRASDAGKKLVAANEQLAGNRKVFEFQIEADGRFVVYDVPPGLFSVQIVAQLEKDDKQYVLQSFGQFNVGDVNEVDLSQMPVDVMRLLSIGEEAPDFEVDDVAGNPVSLSALRGKHVMLAFGALTNPTFKAATDAMKELQQSSEVQDKLALLMISVDDDKDAVAKFLSQERINWPCGLLGGWDQTLLNQYGLKSVPSFWLIDPQGKIALTGARFVAEIRRQELTIQQLVEHAVNGRLQLTEPEDAAAKGDQ